GLPPFNGFLSKELFFTSVIQISQGPVFQMGTIVKLFPFIAWIASIFTFIYCMILIFETFTGPYVPERLDKTPREAPIGMLIAPTVLVTIIILLFFFPNILSKALLVPALSAILPFTDLTSLNTNISIWHGWNLEIFMTIGVIIFGIIMFVYLR